MDFFTQLLNGLGLGSIYALIALGYSMVYGIVQLINFAHGDIIMVGGYAIYVALSMAGMPLWLAVLVPIVVCALAGVLIYWFDRRFALCRTGLPAQTVHKVCLALAIATAPYTMLIPLYSW